MVAERVYAPAETLTSSATLVVSPTESARSTDGRVHVVVMLENAPKPPKSKSPASAVSEPEVGVALVPFPPA